MTADSWTPTLKKYPPLCGLSHRTLCRVAARWLLTECRYHVAGYEVAVTDCGEARDVLGVLDAVAVTDPGANVKIDRRNADDAARQAQMAAEFPDTPWARRKVRVRPHEPRNGFIIECKVSASDLRADLRARKMLKYAPLANRCAVALSPGVLASVGGLAGLGLLGLPESWGVYEASGHARAGDWTDWTLLQIRKPTRGPSMDPVDHAALASTIGHSMTWRALTTRIGRRENDYDGDLGP